MIEFMWTKLTRYALLSFCSFCFFTLILNSVAHAQESVQIVTPVPATSFAKQNIPLSSSPAVAQTTLAPTNTTVVSPTIIADAVPPDTSTPTPTPSPITPIESGPTDSPTPTTTLLSTDTPTAIPTPTTAIPTTIGENTSTGYGLNADKLFSLVNSYRQSKGLASFQTDSRTCTLASSRAPEINNEIATGTMHSGLRSRALPYWNTENIISLQSEEAAFNWWINEPIHRQAIEGNYIYSCVACSGFACAQEFTNYQPK